MTDYTAQQRRDLKAQGKAMANPSNPGRPMLPIRNGADLDNAIRLAGHVKGKSQAAVHSFIKTQAKKLGLTSKIPDTW